MQACWVGERGRRSAGQWTMCLTTGAAIPKRAECAIQTAIVHTLMLLKAAWLWLCQAAFWSCQSTFVLPRAEQPEREASSAAAMGVSQQQTDDAQA